MISIAVAGATGYAGGEILRLLLSHPGVQSQDLTISVLTADSSAGTSCHIHHGHLFPLADRTIKPTDPALLAEADVLFCALPHGASAQLITQLPQSMRVIDCGADFRLENPAEWKQYYGTEYAGSWQYGLPELPGYRQKIINSTRIAVPGCFPTVATLALYPAVVAGIVAAPITVTAITGTSGAGKNAHRSFTASEVLGSLRAYNVAGKHRHVPEIEQNLRAVSGVYWPIVFTPVIAPVSRGILAVCTAELAQSHQDLDSLALQEIYEDAYKDEPCVWLSKSDKLGVAGESLPNTANVLASNLVELSVHVDQQRKTVTIIGVIDNLIKGTAGGAVQNMNLMLGYSELSGLPIMGIAP